MASPFDALFNAQLQTRTIIISEAVSSELLTRATSLLILMEKDNPHGTIDVLINSPGGSADSGMGLHDLLVSSPCKVRTIVTGMCASAGVCIALAATKDNRIATPNSRFMIHQPSTRMTGKASELEIVANELRKTMDRYFTMIANATGKDVATVAKDCVRDCWLSSEEAKEYGLISSIAETR